MNGFHEPEALEALLAENRQRYDLEEGEYTAPEDVKGLFRFYSLALEAGEVQEAFQVLQTLDRSIHAALEAEPDNMELLEAAVECNHQAMRFTAFLAQEFSEFPLLDEILQLTQNLPALQGRYWQARVSLYVNYRNWLQQGGQPETWDTELHAHVQALNEALPTELEAALPSLRQGEYPVQLVLARRAHILYLQTQDDPNRTLLALKALLEDVTLLPDYTPLDKHEALIAIANLLLQYDKHAAARTYLLEAQANLKLASEPNVVLEAQVEALLDECGDEIPYKS